MQTMRYINLLDRESRVKTRNCFIYNNAIVFAVPPHMMSKAIGPDANHIRRLQEQLGKKIRIIREPYGIEDLERFVLDIVSPVKFKSIEVKEGEIVISSGGTQNKASLLGRNKKRYEELNQILEDIFTMKLRVL